MVLGNFILPHWKSLWIPFFQVSNFILQSTEELYLQDCLYKGFQEDKCQLYVFRLAVYFAEHETHEAEKLKWWYWKDKEYPDKE